MFFCGGCRYRVSAQPEWPVHKVKQALFDGGIARANKPEGVRNTPGIQSWADLVRPQRISDLQQELLRCFFSTLLQCYLVLQEFLEGNY